MCPASPRSTGSCVGDRGYMYNVGDHVYMCVGDHGHRVTGEWQEWEE